MKKFKLDRIISIATLVASLVAIVLVLKRPAPVARPQAAAAIAEHAQSFDQKMAQFEQATRQSQSSGDSETSQTQSTQNQPSQGQDSQNQTPQSQAGEARAGAAGASGAKAEVHINSDEIGAVLAQTLGNAGTSELTPDSSLGSMAPTIKDQQV